MNRIEFTDGTSITYEEAAQLIEAEPKGLSTRKMINRLGNRCVLGVLCQSYHVDWHKNGTSRRYAGENSDSILYRMLGENDSLKGTLLERLAHMAAWFRDQ